MIIVKTLNEFLSFIDMAKQQNISYSIIGSEKEGFEGVLSSDKRNNKFYGKYVLLCPSFKVFVSVKSPLDEDSLKKIILLFYSIIPNILF